MSSGDFLSCMREVEEDLDSEDPAASKRALRRIGTHIIRMHHDIETLTESQGTLNSIATEMKDMRKLLWTAQIGVYIFGGFAPLALGFGIYEFNLLRKADEETVKINMEQTVILERIQTQLDIWRINHKGVVP